MNSVFEITLNMPLNAYESLAYKGHWCEWCDKDNGGGKFCYECGKRESEDYGKSDDEDEDKQEDEDEFDPDDYLWQTKGIEINGQKYLKFGSGNVYRFDEFLKLGVSKAEVVGVWVASKNKVVLYD